MNKHRVGVWAMGLLVVIVPALLISGTGALPGGIWTTGQATPQAAEEPIEVSSCRTINESGRYVLTSDIRGSTARECITIIASDVVFDGQGHTLDAGDVDHQTEGIAAGYTEPTITNVTIRDLVITDWTQGVGCRKVAANVTIENVTARHNGLDTTYSGEYHQDSEAYAIYVGDLTRNVTITESLVVNNSVGILIANTTHNVVRDSVLRDNGAGIALAGNTSHNRIVHNRIVDSLGTGISVASRSSNTEIAESRVRGNHLRGNGRGIFVQHTNNPLSVVNNTVSKTANESIWLAVVHGNVTVAKNTIERGNGHGLVLDETSNVVVRHNTIRNVTGTGILLEYASTGNVLERNRIVGAHRGLAITDTSGKTAVRSLVVSGSRNRSILIAGEGNNTVVNTTVRGGGGIDIASSGNYLRSITVTANRNVGLQLDGATDTSIETIEIRNGEPPAFEAVAPTQNVTIRNLSLDTARVSLSLSGPSATVDAVRDLPPPPADMYGLGIAVRIGVTAEQSGHTEPATLTVSYPENVSNVTLWRWTDEGNWQQFHNATIYPQRASVSATLPTNVSLIAAPFVPSPVPTPTPTTLDAATPTSTRIRSTSTEPPTATPQPTEGVTAGFGTVVWLVGFLLAAAISTRLSR